MLTNFKLLYLLITIPVLVLSFNSLSNKFNKLSINPKENAILITGCDSGFGLELSLQLHNIGYKVISACLNESSVTELKDKVSLATRCDVTKATDIDDLAIATENYCKSNNIVLWAVINNAGIAPIGYTDWMNIELFRKVIEINYIGCVAIVKAFLPLLKRTRNSRIINISSLAGKISGPSFGLYSASKFALEAFSKALRAELKPWGIKVANINPGFMRTPMVLGSKDLAVAHFKQSPIEIQNQYQIEDLIEGSNSILAITEDPSVVINRIIDLITESNPSFNNYPGKLAQSFRWVVFIPDLIFELVENLQQATNVKPTNETIEKIQGKQ
eukprot:gene23574-30567_t